MVLRVRRRVSLPLIAAVMAAAVGCSAPAPPTGSSAPGEATVAQVVDGDTIVVHLGGPTGAEERIRLIGIDTPESVDPRTPVECFGKEASDRTRALLPEGTTIRLVRDVEARDRYDRLLAYVYRADDDLFINRALVEEGYASVMTYPPNVAHAPAFSAAAASSS